MSGSIIGAIALVTLGIISKTSGSSELETSFVCAYISTPIPMSAIPK
jgi:hypothetical protein